MSKKNNKQSEADNRYQPDHVLVYSTDSRVALPCLKCAQPKEQCLCQAVIAIDPNAIRPVVQYEKKGRAGKAVTLLRRLPVKEVFLKEFCAHLKRAIGAGGTFYVEGQEGVIEIQGDRRDRLMTLALKYLESYKSD